MLSSQEKVNIFKESEIGEQESLENRQINCNSLTKAINTLNDLLMDGLQHGFFEYKLTCEITKEKKRSLVIEAGKRHKFYIPEEEIIT